ncbi:MAG: response regulator [Patescibacteria group bacterium]
MSTGTRQKPSILIAEDDQFLSALAAEHFIKEGYEVATAQGGEEAIMSLEKNIPDIMLLDIIMPGMGGFEVLKKVRADDRYKNMSIIVFSNLGQQSEIEEAKKLGADDFLVKARFTLKEVMGKVGALIAKKRGE